MLATSVLEPRQQRRVSRAPTTSRVRYRKSRRRTVVHHARRDRCHLRGVCVKPLSKPPAVSECKSSNPLASASKSLFLHDFAVWPEIRANTGHVRRAALSPYRKTEDEGPHLGVCLHGPILVSVFISASRGASSAERAAMRPSFIVKPRCGRRSRQIQRANPNAARWSDQTQGMP